MLISSPDAMTPGLGSIHVINNLPWFHLLGGTLRYQEMLDLQFLIRSEKISAAVANALPLLKIHSKE